MKNPNKNSGMGFSVRRFWKKLRVLLMPVRRQIIFALFLVLIYQIVNLAGPYVLKLIIDALTNFRAENILLLFGLIGAIFLVYESLSLISFFGDRKILRLIAIADNHIFTFAHSKMMSLGLAYHEKENTGNKIIKIQRGVDKLDNLLSNFFWDVAPTVFQVCLTAIALFWVDWRFGLIILIFVPVFIFMTLHINKNVFPFRRRRFRDQEEAAGLMAQSIININTVKSFSQEKRETARFGEFQNRVKENVVKEYYKIFNFNLGRNLVIDLGRLLILGAGIFFVYKAGMSVGTLVFVFTISEKSLISLFRISRLYDRIMESSETVERLYDLSFEESDIKNPEHGLKPKKIEAAIEFENVCYTYRDSNIKALDGVSLKIPSGCVTALVGPSGGGKTTAARMVYRHYDPEQGRILIGGRDLKEYDLESIRKFMAIVPQEVEIFNTSVRENICYAKHDASQQEIEAAAKIANADEFIMDLKHGYDTLVGERGIKLSGGQRQRVGIARAILANPRILIFDEATSNLDSYSERLIQEAIDKIRKGRTMIIIAHRLSTIKKADKIIVLERGRVLEEGSHFELAKIEGGLYQKLLNLQKMGDVD